MSIIYTEDRDLEFLQFCEEKDLKILANYMIYDKEGNRWPSAELKLEGDKILPIDNMLIDFPAWKLIAGELQNFGGHSLANMVRSRGVMYKEILCDVCDSMKSSIEIGSYDKTLSAYDIEDLLLGSVITEATKHLTEEQKTDFLREIGDVPSFSPLTKRIFNKVGIFKASRFAAEVAADIFSNGYNTTVKQIVSAAPLALASVARLYPIGAILSSAVVAGAASANYKVTIPCVIQVAYMRRVCEKINLI